MQKLMLVFPPVSMTPLADRMCCLPMGIAYLGAALRDRYEVRLLDAVVEGHHLERYLSPNVVQYGLDYPEIQRRIEAFQPDVLGVSTLFSSQFPTTAEILRRAKAWNPDLITVTGGTHPSFLPERSLQRAPALDYIVLGEGDDSLPALLEAIARGQSPAGVDGLAYRENGAIRKNPKTRFISNLDTLPFPARDLLPVEKYFDINIPFLFFSRSQRNISFTSSRGCPFHCTFCSSTRHWGNSYRMRSPEHVLAEMEHLIQKFGVEELKFEDDNLTVNPGRAKAIFRGMIERGFNLKWNMPNGAMVMSLDDDELLDLMKRSGCYEVVLAFESGDQDTVDKIIQKPINLQKAERIVERVKAHGIDTHAFFIVGFPGETRQQVRNTFAYAHKLKLDKLFIFTFNPLPGTELTQRCLEQGLIGEDFQFEDNSYALLRFDTKEYTARELEAIVDREHFRSIFSTALRHPVKFIRKYVGRVAFRPDLIRTLGGIIRNRVHRLMHPA
jgi:magnesium-protoporphyrin IX monomethyl ester (oxidative) cyclase